MKIRATAVLSTLCLAFSVNAQAINVNTVGDSFSVNYAGTVDGTPQAGLSASADFELTAIGGGGADWTFDVDISNTSSAPITGSRVSILGFDTDPDVNVGMSSASGVFDQVRSGNLPTIGSVEICFAGGGGGNCAGGGGAGVTLGNTGSFTATLHFDSAISSLELDQFVLRFQSIDGSPLGSSGAGVGTVVPIPAAAWLFGSALLGLFGVRRHES